MIKYVGSFLSASLIFSSTMAFAQSSEEQLTDLTGGVTPIILELDGSFQSGGELSNQNNGLTTRSDLRYVVKLKNQTHDPIQSSSLILVVDAIVEVARGRDVSHLVEVYGYDGITSQGKPFFRIPEGNTEVLSPFAESETVIVRILNPDLLRLTQPSFLVQGIPKTQSNAIDRLRDTLLRKGLLSPEEAADIFNTPIPTQP